MPGQGRRFVFTLNNYASSDLTSIQEFANSEDCVYLCYGLEEAPTTGTPHVQGYFSIRRPQRVTTIGRRYGSTFPWMTRARYDLASGTRIQNKHYCFKTRPGDTPNQHTFESDQDVQGQRTDIQLAVQTLRERGLQATAQDHPEVYVKYHGGLRSLQEQLLGHREPSEQPTVLWFYGPTGCGKTREAFRIADEFGLSIWKSSDTLRWWPGYSQQDMALFDDFRKDFCTFHRLLTLLDRYPTTVEVKGGHVNLKSELFIITSPYPPWQVYETREDVGQLMRRITQCVHFGVPDRLESETVKIRFFRPHLGVDYRTTPPDFVLGAGFRRGVGYEPAQLPEETEIDWSAFGSIDNFVLPSGKSYRPDGF